VDERLRHRLRPPGTIAHHGSDANEEINSARRAGWLALVKLDHDPRCGTARAADPLLPIHRARSTTPIHYADPLRRSTTPIHYKAASYGTYLRCGVAKASRSEGLDLFTRLGHHPSAVNGLKRL